MIETVQTENGPVLRVDGRLLASAKDPGAEAEAWVLRRQDLLDCVRGVFVLGLGSGYHVAALRRRTAAKIVVIEHSAEIAEAARALGVLGEGDAQIVVANGSRQLRASDPVRVMIEDSFLVLVHGPSRARSPKFYDQARRQLLGREWGALTWAWKLRGLPPLEQTERIAAAAASAGDAEAPLLSIHDLAQTELVTDSDHRERMLVKALRELVK